MTYYSRADNILDFAGASLTEKAIWQAVEDSGIDYVDWVARKETQKGLRLHLYVELKNEDMDELEITAIIDKRLRLMKKITLWWRSWVVYFQCSVHPKI
jgi:hypothetical protein